MVHGLHDRPLMRPSLHPWLHSPAPPGPTARMPAPLGAVSRPRTPFGATRWCRRSRARRRRPLTRPSRNPWLHSPAPPGPTARMPALLGAVSRPRTPFGATRWCRRSRARRRRPLPRPSRNPWLHSPAPPGPTGRMPALLGAVSRSPPALRAAGVAV